MGPYSSGLGPLAAALRRSRYRASSNGTSGMVLVACAQRAIGPAAPGPPPGAWVLWIADLTLGSHQGGCVAEPRFAAAVDHGHVLGRWLVEHNGDRLAELFVELADFAPPAALPVAIERGEGLIVELIIDAGHTCS